MAGLESTPAEAIDLSSARYLNIDAPVREEDIDPKYGSISRQFPGVNADDLTWSAVVDLTSGVIQSWPEAGYQPTTFHLRVKDAGVYTLLDKEYRPLVRKTGYVPEEVLPDSGGDEIVLQLDAHGKIGFWLDTIDLSDFEMGELNSSELAYPNENGAFVADAEPERPTPAPAMTRDELRERRRVERRALRNRRASIEATEAAIASNRRKRQDQNHQLADQDLREPTTPEDFDEQRIFRF